MSDRIAVMNEGRVEQVGSAEDVYERPTTAFVAGFIGVSNLMPGVVSSAGGDRGKVRLDSGVEVEAATTGCARASAATPSCAPRSCGSRWRARPAPRAPPAPPSRGSSRARSSSAPRPRSSCGWPATCRSPCSSRTPTRRSASACPAAARAVELSWAPEHTHVVAAPERGRRRSQGRQPKQEMLDQPRRRANREQRQDRSSLARGGDRRPWRLPWRLAACGGDDGVGGGEDGRASVAEGGEATGDVLISNWPGYIDPGDNGTVAEFEERVPASTVEYKEDISDNIVFFNKVKPAARPGQLRRAQHVRRHRLDGEADVRARLPAGARPRRPAERVREHPARSSRSPTSTPSATSRCRGRGARPGSSVDTDQGARDRRASATCFDPKYKGKVTMLTEMRDTVPLMLQSEGNQPDEATEGGLAGGDRQAREARRRRPDPRASPATSTPRT